MDFLNLPPPRRGNRPTKPEDVFRLLPKGKDSPNDLWRGQTDALREWDGVRSKNDVLISLSTGAGKTMIGLLIAQSLVNEDIPNIIYLCNTIDLVKQTAKEAEKLRIPYTIRTEGDFSNDLFEQGKAFCITTYKAALQPYTVFARQFKPGAVIFDDAHVGESAIRSQLTMTIRRDDHNVLFGQIAQLMRPYFKSIGIDNRFVDVFNQSSQETLLAPPSAINSVKDALTTVLRNANVAKDSELQWSWGYLKDKFHLCCVTFSGHAVEFSLPFLPTLALPIFNDSHVRRVYLSATLQYESEFVRAYGRLPAATIQPKSDAGEGERLILFSSRMAENSIINTVEKLSSQDKVLIAVPSAAKAKPWQKFASPVKSSEFSERLDQFRRADKGCFVLVSRFDGIDLPGRACNVMVMDGMPSGTTLLERHQWESLDMYNFQAARIANRLTQLFGRINRGRADHSVFLINGRQLCNWMLNTRNTALFPKLLQDQIFLGEAVQKEGQLVDSTKVHEFLRLVLDRDERWTTYYARYIENREIDDAIIARAKDDEARMVLAAKAEAVSAKYAWEGNIADARMHLEKVTEEISKSDNKLAGWHNLIIGSYIEMEGDMEAAGLEYQRAKARLGFNLHIRQHESSETAKGGYKGFASYISRLILTQSADTFTREFKRIEKGLKPFVSFDGTSNEAEEAFRFLGEILGFETVRPDSNQKIGPDVIWIDRSLSISASFELKTGKRDSARYSKDEIGQGHNHLEWIKSNYSGVNPDKLYYVGPSGTISEKASPADSMLFIDEKSVNILCLRLLNRIEELRRLTRTARESALTSLSNDPSFGLQKVLEDFAPTKIGNLDQH